MKIFLLLSWMFLGMSMNGCTSDKKADNIKTEGTLIDLATLDSVTFRYGDYFNGYKSYELNLSQKKLSGVWDRFDLGQTPPVRQQAQKEINLSTDSISELGNILKFLDSSIVSADKSICGQVSEGPSSELILKNSEIEIRIADVNELPSTCSDAYAAANSLDSIFEFLTRNLPEPIDSSEFKP